MLLSTLYVLSFALKSVIHPLVHSCEYHAEIHTAEAEKDPCHLEIYHGVKENTANHHTHLTGVEDKCWLCDVICDHEHLLAQAVHYNKIITKKTKQVSVTSFLCFKLYKYSSPRAPPIA